MLFRFLVTICCLTPLVQGQRIGWDLGELKSMALEGERSAQLRLGLAYSSGIGVEKNSRESFYWYEKAAKQGDPVASHYLARAYAKGLGTHRDPKQVIHWYRQAALGSSSFARNKLVTLLRASDSGSANRVEAYAWCLIGDEMGDLELRKTLRLLTEQEESVTQAAGKAKAIELKQLMEERNKELLPHPRDPNRGTYLYPTGERYFGQVETGQPHGFGIVDAPNGDRFYGKFILGRANGYGMLIDKTGRILFAGLWRDDKAVAEDGKPLPLAVTGK